MRDQIEGGTTAYCAECEQFGHYQTAHHMRPPEPTPRPWWLR